MTSPVRVFSEFQPLEEVIVGRAYPASAFDAIPDAPLRAMLQQIAAETEEDFLALADVLRQAGVTVRRPQIIGDLYERQGDHLVPRAVDTGAWKAPFPNPPVFPRDLTLTYGHRIVNVYSRSTHRWLETLSLYEVFAEYYREGASWISMPPPYLDSTADSYASYERRAILFHAAAFLRCGRDVFHTLPASEHALAKGTAWGLRWMREILGDAVRFHPVPRHGHLDSKFALLRPGLLMTWLSREELPAPLQDWDIIPIANKEPLPAEFVHLRERRFYKDFVERWLQDWIGSVDETYFDVNVLSLGPDRVLMNGYSPDLFAKIRRYGIEPIPVNFRHRIFWDGALHCITLDVRRTGECEDYF